MPTIGAFSDSAPIVTAGIDCVLSVAPAECEGAAGVAAGRFVAGCVAAARRALAVLAPAELRVVANAAPATSRIAAYAIHLDALRLGPTIPVPSVAPKTLGPT